MRVGLVKFGIEFGYDNQILVGPFRNFIDDQHNFDSTNKQHNNPEAHSERQVAVSC